PLVMSDRELLHDVEDGVRRLAGTDPTDEDILVVERVRSMLEELRVVQEDLASQNTELEELQQEVGEERQRYAELFDLAPDAYLVTDEYGKILEANRSAVRLLELEEQALVGKPLSVFV